MFNLGDIVERLHDHRYGFVAERKQMMEHWYGICFFNNSQNIEWYEEREMFKYFPRKVEYRL